MSDPGPSEATDQPYRDRSPKKQADAEKATIWQRATYRWAAVTTVMGVLLILYTQHPYYKGGQFAPWRPFYTFAFVVWITLGLLYCKATIQKFHQQRYVMRDGALHLLLLAKLASEFVPRRVSWCLIGAAGSYVGARFVLGEKDPTSHPLTILGATAGAVGVALVVGSILRPGPYQKRFWRAVKNRRVRTTLLAIIVKGFFTPLMTGFVTHHATSIMDGLLRHHGFAPLNFVIPANTSLPQSVHMWFAQLSQRLPEVWASLSPTGTPWTNGEIRWFLDVAYDCVFFVDCGMAWIGYSSESRWLGNKTRSVEPTAFGWAVCLACYPPFNNVLGTYLPLENGPQVVSDPGWLLALRAGTVFLFAIYASATVAFGFKFSNLTNRGIVMRGPYRFVRHPAYLCKCLAWWLENMPNMNVVRAVFLTFLCGVYALRAWTEERHLSRDPDYLVYKKKTPWVLIPGIY
ncbi:MAG TPA: hypothetical protein VIF62_37295 [Labilithrix sp.]